MAPRFECTDTDDTILLIFDRGLPLLKNHPLRIFLNVR